MLFEMKMQDCLFFLVRAFFSLIACFRFSCPGFVDTNIPMLSAERNLRRAVFLFVFSWFISDLGILVILLFLSVYIIGA